MKCRNYEVYPCAVFCSVSYFLLSSSFFLRHVLISFWGKKVALFTLGKATTKFSSTE